jgi:hypothetical protein
MTLHAEACKETNSFNTFQRAPLSKIESRVSLASLAYLLSDAEWRGVYTFVLLRAGMSPRTILRPESRP